MECTKFLDLHLDDNLNCKHQIDSICTKLEQFCYPLYMLVQIENQLMFQTETAYSGDFQFLLRYGVIFWGSSVHKTASAEEMRGSNM